MVEPRNEDQHPLPLIARPHRPVHREGRGDSGEARAEGRQVDGAGDAVEHHAHEEIAGLGVVELLGVENVEAVLEQRRRDFGDDPRPIGAGQGQDMAQGRHCVGGLEESGRKIDPSAPHVFCRPSATRGGAPNDKPRR